MGQRLAAFDKEGNITAFYDTIDSPAPQGTSTIDITDDEWLELLEGQARGDRMTVDDAGRPKLLAPLPPTPDQIAERNGRLRDELLLQASIALAPLQTAIMLNDATDDEKNAARQWVAFTRAVKSIDLKIDDPTWPTPPATRSGS